MAVNEKGLVFAKNYVWSKLPTSPDEADGQLIEEAHMDFPEVSGAGWAISTADDYAKWMRCWLEPSSGPLSQEMIKELRSPRSIVPPEEIYNERFEGVMAYGLGWFMSSYKGHMVYWHTGGLIGAGSYVLLCPDIKWGMTFFANIQDASFKLKGLAVEFVGCCTGYSRGRAGRNERKSTKKLSSLYKKIVKKSAEEREKLYPNAPPTPTVAHSLPLEGYTGTYRHAGYGSLTFAVEKDEDGKECLQVDSRDRTWKYMLGFQHVNAENWVVSRRSANSPWKSLGKAESKVSADGKVTWAIAMEPAMPDVLTWFAKVEQ